MIYLFYGIGFVLRVVLPWLAAWLEEDAKFDPKFLLQELVGALAALIPWLITPEGADILRLLEEMNKGQLQIVVIVTAIGYGWFGSDLGRKILKRLEGKIKIGA